MILRIASLLIVVIYLKSLPFSVKISHVCKYYGHFLQSTFWEHDDPDYDFIVVGAGSAGSVVANRLSKHNKVLLIEAGGTPFYANQIPVLSTTLLHIPEVDYMYKSIPQNNSCLGQIDHVSYWPRGKLLGGTSNLHCMIYSRGHPADFDNWAHLTGDETWKYKNVLKYFDRSINYRGQFPSNYHRADNYGTQQIEPFWLTPFHDTVMQAGKELGFEANIDLNGPQRPGFGPPEAYLRNGQRESSYTAFLEPVLHRDNLVISKYSQAVKIELDKSKRATGIWYVQYGRRKFVRARKEIIISAGSVDSPKLLMLSGIGPKNHLKKVGIKPIVNLPGIGQNLKDHLMTFLFPFSINGPPHFSLVRDLGVADLIEYYRKGTGFFTSPHGSFSMAFFTSTMNKNSSVDWNDFQMAIAHMSPNPYIPSEFSRFTKIREDIFEDLFRDSGKNDEDGFMLSLTLGRPKSSGFIKLRSRDPTDDPIIDPKYLSHPDDVTRFVEAIKFGLQLVESTEAFKKVNATYANIPLDECRNYDFRSDEYWTCYVRHMAVTMYHPVGTCRMGNGASDKLAVVDSKLRVMKMKGLRVADASVMPDIPNANTNAPAVMVGEKVSDIIREYWAQQYMVCRKMEMIFTNLKMCFSSKIV